MLGLDTYIIKQIGKWISKAKTEAEVMSRARIIMGSLLAIHYGISNISGMKTLQDYKSQGENNWRFNLTYYFVYYSPSHSSWDRKRWGID